jgi:hypothetical protein
MFLEKSLRSLRAIGGAVVEIGSYLGKSTIYLARTGEIIYAVDPHKGEFSGGKTKPTLPEFQKNLNKAGVSALVKPIVKTSEEANRTWKSPVKFLFIDGLHDEVHAQQDFELWSRHLSPNGIVAMHDAFCGWRGAGNVAMRQIVYSPEFGEIGVVGSIIFGVKKNVSIFGRVLKIFRQCTIELCQSIYRIDLIPKRIQFILVHRLLRIFLINRFTSVV